MWTCGHLYDLIGALARGRTPRANSAITAVLLLQLRTVTVLIIVGTGVGWRRQSKGGC